MNRRPSTETTIYGIKKNRGPFATVYACPCCKHYTKALTGGRGRGSGLARGSVAMGAMIKHVTACHPEQAR